MDDTGKKRSVCVDVDVDVVVEMKQSAGIRGQAGNGWKTGT